MKEKFSLMFKTYVASLIDQFSRLLLIFMILYLKEDFSDNETYSMIVLILSGVILFTYVFCNYKRRSFGSFLNKIKYICEKKHTFWRFLCMNLYLLIIEAFAMYALVLKHNFIVGLILRIPYIIEFLAMLFLTPATRLSGKVLGIKIENYVEEKKDKIVV